MKKEKATNLIAVKRPRLPSDDRVVWRSIGAFVGLTFGIGHRFLEAAPDAVGGWPLKSPSKLNMPTRFIAELLGRQICLASDLCTTARENTSIARVSQGRPGNGCLFSSSTTTTSTSV
jgi:hypothetical protein